MNALRWEKVRRNEYGKVEEFLRLRESRYVSACAKFLQLKSRNDEVWALPGAFVSGCDEPYSAVLLHSRQSLFPVFSGIRDLPDGNLVSRAIGLELWRQVPTPSFLDRIFMKIPIHSIQGPIEDAKILEMLIENKTYVPAERIDYDIMTVNNKPSPVCFGYGPANLVLRSPEKKDVDEIYDLQAAYEKEEVLPTGAEFYPAGCRANLMRLLKSEKMLLACMGSKIVGKINTSARSFNKYQIGGVYVLPNCRGLGIAVRMTAAFIEDLLSDGRGASLFVKKSNPQARAVYNRTGFTVHGNYRISYY